jgi:peptidoglycan/xylan/chitin deacetylase (PgdA/CDA1 family)
MEPGEWAQRTQTPEWAAIDTPMTDQPRTALSRRIKHAVVAGCGRAIRWSGTGRRFFAGRAPIVFYHGIWPAGAPALARFQGMEIDRLQHDLTVLAAHFDFVSLENLLHYNREERPRARPLLAVCFDDGCDMIRSGAADVLDALGVPATMFVVTACIDNRHLMWMHKLQAIAVTCGPDRLVLAYNRLMAETGAGPPIRSRRELTAATWCWPMNRKEEYVDALYRACAMPPTEAYLDHFRPYLTWAELRTWQARGHTVGLHTRSHPFCDRLAAAEIAAEIITPAAELRRELGVDFLPFAYPFGNRLAAASEVQLADEAGLACTLGVGGLSRRGTDPFRLDRVAGEDGLDPGLFGKPVLEAVLQAAWPAARPHSTLVVRHPSH